MDDRYPEEVLGPDDDNGTMPSNVAELASEVIGCRIVKVEDDASVPGTIFNHAGLALTLDNGRRVFLVDTSDCCAYTNLRGVIRHLDKIDHVILGVGTTEGYSKWHIYADLGDVLELSVDWSPGNAFYYGYGFDIVVEEGAPATDTEIEKAIKSIEEANHG